MELTKESWSNLTDDEKTAELQLIIPGADYKKYKEHYEKYYNNSSIEFDFEHPCLTLKLIDPVMTYMLVDWLYRKGNRVNQIPIFGYALEKITLDEKSLMGFSKEESEILSKALNIISNKINND